MLQPARLGCRSRLRCACHSSIPAKCIISCSCSSELSLSSCARFLLLTSFAGVPAPAAMHTSPTCSQHSSLPACPSRSSNTRPMWPSSCRSCCLVPSSILIAARSDSALCCVPGSVADRMRTRLASAETHASAEPHSVESLLWPEQHRSERHPSPCGRPARGAFCLGPCLGRNRCTAEALTWPSRPSSSVPLALGAVCLVHIRFRAAQLTHALSASIP
mmetsp:Transcript_45343/g.102371  ORF Transcript_45343/g.102371 Transcript_45343/m.102371 type:complete len:218 (+) Transcript_45343:197-850(+)